MELTKEFIKEVLKQQGKERRAATIKLNKGEYPLDRNFVCPYCKYIPRNGQGTARIYSDTRIFLCFSCQKRSNVLI
jgi:hypothetical protein